MDGKYKARNQQIVQMLNLSAHYLKVTPSTMRKVPVRVQVVQRYACLAVGDQSRPRADLPHPARMPVRVMQSAFYDERVSGCIPRTDMNIGELKTRSRGGIVGAKELSRAEPRPWNR